MDKVAHFEIPSNNLDKAKEFYSKIFGWESEKYSDEYLTVRTVPIDENKMPKETGAINGGIQKKGPRAKAVTIVMMVDDIDEKLEMIKKAGGKVAIAKEPIGDMGFYAQFDDLDGNRMGLFQTK